MTRDPPATTTIFATSAITAAKMRTICPIPSGAGLIVPVSYPMEETVSHTTEIQTQVKDLDAVRAACKRLALPGPTMGTYRLFDGRVATGLAVKLPEWTYPAVFDGKGNCAYDTFGGRWGDEAHLKRFTQAYAVAKATMEARKKGYRVAEQTMANGTIRLLVSGVR